MDMFVHDVELSEQSGLMLQKQTMIVSEDKHGGKPTCVKQKTVFERCVKVP